MTTRDLFRATMRERRRWPLGSADREYLTRTARQLFWMLQGIPTTEWDARMKEADRRNLARKEITWP